MKRMDIFCSSPKSTAICSSIDHKSMIRRATTPLDRLISNSKTYISCNSSKFSPIDHPNSHYHPNNVTRSFSNSNSSKTSHDHQIRRKSTADITDKIPYIDWISESAQSSPLILHSHGYNQHSKPPPRSSSYSSSRYSSSIYNYQSPSLKSSSSARSRDQVVVLWVSIHCKGCEGKVRKHISKMEGVTSFSIDLGAKKVTVIGNVTPLGVLSSLSKIKNAQLWPS